MRPDERRERTRMDREARVRLDAHVHLIALDGARHGCFIAEKRKKGIEAWYLRRLARVGRDLPDEELDIAYADRLATLVRQAEHVDQALVFALDGLYDDNGRLDPRTEVILSNDWAIEAVRRHPDVFVFGASVHPARADALEELDRCAEAGSVCVKWVPPSQNIDPSDRRYERFYERMGQHGMVLTSHTGYEHSVSVTDQSLGDPARLSLPLEVGLKVVAGHAGMSGWYHRTEYFGNFADMVGRYENLFGDTSAILAPERFPYRRRLLETPGVLDRLIQGTDFPSPPLPVLWPLALGPARALELQFMRNPFDRDCVAKRLAGFGEEHFLRGHDVFLGDAYLKGAVR